MKIGIFTDTYKPQINGVVTSISLMEKMLLKNGHEPYIFTITHPDVDSLKEPEYVVRIPSVKFWGNKEHRIGLIYSPFACRKAKELGIEIIHTHAPFSLGIFGHITATKLKVPEVFTYHTMLEDYVHYLKVNRILPDNFAKKYSRIFCNLADGVIVPTPKVYEKLKSYGVKRPMFVLPTGIDLEIFKRKFSLEDRVLLRKRYGLSEDDKVLIFVGRIAKEKNIDTLIDYQRELSKRDSAFKLVIVGSGDYLSELISKVQKLGLENQVIFTGKKDYEELPYYYNMADAFVIASTSETQGLVVVEAMAAGLPVIAINDMSFHPMVRDGINGYLFNSKEEYLEKVVFLLNHQELMGDFGNNSVLISDEFSADKFYQELINIYEQIIEEFKQKDNMAYAN